MASAFSIHHEVEIKLDAGPEFAVPDLAELPGVMSVEQGETEHLSAVYVDSADLRLARHRTTFRRRTGGRDEGWHLKLPGRKDGRTEIREPVGDGVRDVPPNLLALIRVQLRGESVDPVARIVTERSILLLKGAGDVVLAEVADDHVTAQALGETMTGTSWREIEVELVDGETSLLEAVHEALVQAGARPATAKSKLQRILSQRLADVTESAEAAESPQTAGAVAIGYVSDQVATLVTEDPQVRMDSEDAVHQMRVATRRLRTSLATFRPLFTPGSAEPLRAELKWLGGVLGDARDAEVMREQLQREVAELPAELVLGPVARRIDLELSATYQQAHDAVIEALDGGRYLELVQSLEAFIADPPFSERADAPAKKELRRRTRKACARVITAVEAADDASSADERDHLLHEVRKAAKRARYGAEAAAPVIGKRAKNLSTAMEAIQEDLGDHQDAVVERTWLRDLGVRSFLHGENGFTFGLLHGRTELRAEHDEQEFTRLWKRARKTAAVWPGERSELGKILTPGISTEPLL